MKCMKSFCCFGLLLFTLCSCASMYSQKTEAELTYDELGRPVFKIYNTKAYQGLQINVEKDSNGITKFSYSAQIVDSNTVAAEVAKSSAALTGMLRDVINLSQGVVVGQ